MTVACTSAETVTQVRACLTCHYSFSQNTQSSWQLTTKEKKPSRCKYLCLFALCSDICGASQIIMIIKIYFRKLHKSYTDRVLSLLCTESTSVPWHINFQSRNHMGSKWCTGFALSFAQEQVPQRVWRCLSEQLALTETIDAASIYVHEYGSQVPSNLERHIFLTYSGTI